MAEKQIMLITGVASYWGSRIAERLLALDEKMSEQSGDGDVGQISGYHVIGLDTEPPAEPLKGLDFIQADVRNPLFVDLLRSEGVHTIFHSAFIDTDRPSEKAFDLNVIGTMKVFGAAAEAGVKKIILRSSTAVYGAQPTNPAFLTENHPLNGSKTNGTIRNLVEVEAFVNGFQRQVPDMIVSILRFTNIIGPTVDSPMTRFLQLNIPLTLLGFDPLMQVIHEDDVCGAVLHAMHNDTPGVFNVSAEGILPLGKLLGLAGRHTIPVVHLFAYWGSEMRQFTGKKSQRYFPIEPNYLRYPWVVDLSRMREEFGYNPVYTAEEALREFAGHLRLRKYKPDSIDLAYDEERLRDTIERRGRLREQQHRQSIDQQGNAI